MKKYKTHFLACITIFAIIFSSCITTNISEQDKTALEFTQRTKTSEYYLTQIPLDFTKIEIMCFPNEDTVTENGWFNSVFTKDFALKNDCFVAFNTNPFNVKHGFQYFSNKRKNVGIHKVNGKVLNPRSENFAALVFSDGKADIIQKQTEAEIAKADYAFGGFSSIIHNGKMIGAQKKQKDARTVVGLNRDKTKLFVLTGKHLSIDRCSEILLKADCTEAINFDGGSSTQVFERNAFYSGVCILPGASVGFRLK